MSKDEKTICDRCSADILLEEALTGDDGTEFEGATLCEDCNEQNNFTKKGDFQDDHD